MYFEERQLQELERTQYPLTREADFDAFWAEAKTRVETHTGELQLKEVPGGGEWSHRVYDATLPALDGTPLKAWLYVPRAATAAWANPWPGSLSTLMFFIAPFLSIKSSR